MSITTETLEKKYVAYATYKGNYMGNPQVYENLIKKILTWSEENKIQAADKILIAAYQDDPNVTPPEEMILEICLPISEDIKPTGDINSKYLSEGLYATKEFKLAKPEEYKTAWEEVVNWTVANNYEIDMSRESFEYYLNCADSDPDKLHHVKICLSIKSK